MTYQVLARKWRPKTFESLVGQEHVVRALSHGLADERLHHAYLFTGTRGVGKTTLARILAKSLNCDAGVSASPCGVCSACTEIDAGRFVDLLEVDAATNTKVDEMRQLLENAVYAPTRGRFKVYVIDEVHMLSNSAFNAMLKTLEEPPAHLKFILATTDPQKIPVTVLSRCLQFNLKQLSPPLIAAHLKEILEAEQIKAEPLALNLIARSASGSMRDALSLLDQAIAHGGGEVLEGAVRDMLGSVDLDYLFDILDALLARDAGGMLKIAEAMQERSLSFSEALSELAQLFTGLQVAQLAPSGILDDYPARERLFALAQQFDPEFVHLAYQIVIHAREELSLAPDEFSGFSMALLRLYTFDPCYPAPSVVSGDGGRHVQAPPSALGIEGTERTERTRVASKAPACLVPKKIAAQAEVVPQEMPTAIPLKETPAKEAPPQGASPKGAARAEASIVGKKSVDWATILAHLELTGMARELAQHCELKRMEAHQVALNLSPTHQHLLIKSSEEKISMALSQYFGAPVRLSIHLEEVQGDTPAATKARRQRERQNDAVAAIEGDAFVREAIERFDARLIESSIKPI